MRVYMQNMHIDDDLKTVSEFERDHSCEEVDNWRHKCPNDFMHNTDERQQWFEGSPEENCDITCKLDCTVANYIEKSCNSEDRCRSVMMQQGSPFVCEMEPRMISTLEKHRYKPVASFNDIGDNRE